MSRVLLHRSRFFAELLRNSNDFNLTLRIGDRKSENPAHVIQFSGSEGDIDDLIDAVSKLKNRRD